MIFREQQTSDFGVDAQVELKDGTEPSGRLIGVQIKSGKSWFNEPTEQGWIFRPSDRHIRYWTAHSLPTYILLVDLDSRTFYWQKADESTLKAGPRGGIYLEIPSKNIPSAAKVEWLTAADRFASSAADDFTDNIHRLSPTTANNINRLRLNSKDAAVLLCAHLARGRRAPELTVRTLLRSAPSWLRENEGQGYAALASFALSHELWSLSADALELGRVYDPGRELSDLVNAGLIVLPTDSGRAARLFAEAEEKYQGFNPRLALGKHVLSQLLTNSRAKLPIQVEERLREFSNDAVVLSYLSDQMSDRSNLDASIELAQSALALEPNEWVRQEDLAHKLIRRSQTSFRRPSDVDRAIDLSRLAVSGVHSWNGPSEKATRTLLQCLLTAGRFAEALEQSLASPRGLADPEDAVRPSVIASAAVAARALNRSDLVLELIDALPHGVDKQFAILQDKNPLSNQDSIREWTDLLTGIDDMKPEQLLHTVSRLADLGIDRTEELSFMVEQGMIDEGLPRTLGAVAAAVIDLDKGLPALRILADSNSFAATKLCDLLIDSRRLDDAQAVAEAAYVSFKNPERLVQRGILLFNLNRTKLSEQAFNNALTHTDLEPESRRTAHRMIARIVLEHLPKEAPAPDDRLSRAQRHLIECTRTEKNEKADSADVWRLISLQLRLGNASDAFDTLRQHQPEVSSIQEAKLWAAIFSSRPTDLEACARMLDLARKFRDDADFSAHLLTHIILRTRDPESDQASKIDDRPVAPSNLHAEAFEGVTAHLARHGDRSPIKVLSAPTTDSLLAQLTDLLLKRQLPFYELVEAIGHARIPAGMLATFRHEPYSAILASRSLGFYLAGNRSTGTEDDLDEVAAQESVGQDIVADLSSLQVSSLLNEFVYARGLFRRIIIPTASQLDLLAARSELTGRSSTSGSVAYDRESAALVAHDLDTTSQLATLQRFEQLRSAAATTHKVETPSISILGDVAFKEGTPWLSPIALAKHLDLTLWSDDASQREMARAFGIRAFGTLALQRVRADQLLGMDDLDRTSVESILLSRRHEVLNALAERVVDQTIDADILIEQARIEGWRDLSLASATIGRAAWWDSSASPWTDLRQIIGAAEADCARAEDWQVIAMVGAGGLPTKDPAASAVLIATVCLVDPAVTLREERSVRLLMVGMKVATRHGAHSPVDYLMQAAAELAAIGFLENAHAVAAGIRDHLSASSRITEQ